MSSPRFLASFILSVVLAACGLPGSGPDDVDVDGLADADNAVACDAPEGVGQSGSSDNCSLVFDGCDDDVFRELLCFAVENGDGQYERRLVCSCAEERATFGAVIIQDASCTDGDEQPAATYEAAWRACDRAITIR